MWQWDSNLLDVYIVVGQEAERVRQGCLYPSKAHPSGLLLPATHNLLKTLQPSNMVPPSQQQALKMLVCRECNIFKP